MVKRCVWFERKSQRFARSLQRTATDYAFCRVRFGGEIGNGRNSEAVASAASDLTLRVCKGANWWVEASSMLAGCLPRGRRLTHGVIETK